ncbi:MAG: VOC family protein, partial [Gammaproteobacteria bacterium]
MKTLLLSILFAGALFAQLPAPNESGVAMGHLHLTGRDADAHRKFWVEALGGAIVKLGNFEVFKFPDVLVMIRKGEPSGGSEGSTINHLGFKVKNLKAALDRCEAAGVRVDPKRPNPQQAFVYTPDNVRVELTEEPEMSAPIAHHHIHFSTAAVDETKAWYVKMLGATPGKRGRFEAADVPGANLSFSPAQTATAATKGRALDHIGFEVRDLEAFCRKLEALGVKFDVPYRKVPQLGIAIAFFTDPWGTYIELTEGLGQILAFVAPASCPMSLTLDGCRGESQCPTTEPRNPEESVQSDADKRT